MKPFEGPALSILIVLTFLLGSSEAHAQTESGTAREAGSPQSTAQLWQPGDPGQKLFIRGRVTDSGGAPLAGVVVSLRQTDGNGEYHPERYRATLRTDEQGSYQLRTVLPGQEYGFRHIHISFSHNEYASLATEIVFKGDPNLDPVAAQELAIPLETAVLGDDEVLLGQFQVVLTPVGEN